MEQIIHDEEDAVWAARNEHWLAKQSRPRQYRAKRERECHPLILCGNSVSLRIDKGTLLIRDGFTHWPQGRKEYRFFKGSLDLPPKIIMLDGNGGLTFDVINWLSQQGIPLIRLDFQGNAVSVIGGAGYAAEPEKVLWQIQVRNDPEQRVRFCCDLITKKLQGCLRTLAEIAPNTAKRTTAQVAVEHAILALHDPASLSVDDIRITEARAAARYFATWKGLPLKWRSQWKYPIPPEWLTFPQRGSLTNWTYVRNRHAKHPVNAMLNYAYGMMYSTAHIDAVKSGYDPRRGIMHQDRDDAFAWVLDAVEPMRPAIEAALFKFILNTEFTGADFTAATNGVCRLTPQLARTVATVVS